MHSVILKPVPSFIKLKLEIGETTRQAKIHNIIITGLNKIEFCADRYMYIYMYHGWA